MVTRPQRDTRIILFRLATVVVFVILIARLAMLQFFTNENYQEQAIFNRTRVVKTEGIRGVIYDRDGRILAANKARYDVVIIPAELPDDPDYQRSQELRYQVYNDLIALITDGLQRYPPVSPTAAPAANPDFIFGSNINPAPTLLSADEMDVQVTQREAGSAFKPIVVAENLPRSVAWLVDEGRFRLPGVNIQLYAERSYSAGYVMSHILGYMGPIPEQTINSYVDQGYSREAWVGWSGLEFSAEKTLHGQSGSKVIEVDVNGREKRVIGKETAAQPGHNLILTIDLELQQTMFEALIEGVNPLRSHSAVAVALDPRNGHVLAMASLPAYDNNIFANGITGQEYLQVANAPGKPLINHAISSIYPPGSSFKMIPAAGGLQEKVITARTLLNAPGIIYLPNRNFPDNLDLAQPFVCWIYKLGGKHGDINVRQAIAESCDIFFYKLGGGWPPGEFEGLGVETLAYYAQQFGLGAPTGIDLPGESAGLVPDPKWKRLAKGERWVTGDTYNMSIGQGDVLATPLQIALMTSAIANDGLVFQPQLVAAVTDAESHLLQKNEPKLIREIPVDPQHLATVREGMWMAVNWEYGTATNAALPDVEVAGKTGTAEFFDPEIPRDGRGNLPSHAWFTSFAPYQDPEIVVTVFVYNGGEGSAVAIPIAQRILRSYFDIKARDAAAGSRPVLDQLSGDGS
ncbi:MAG: penicillin-binding protein 2 [Chloroflexi bacterium]|nr:penicillin-binding protein 2 [Chloroflexota bacterium]